MTTIASRLLLCVIALSLACASATDVERRGRAVLAATDPERHRYCPAEALALARAEVAFARAAAERGEPLEAARHLERAEGFRDEVEQTAASCRHEPAAPPPRPESVRDDDDDGVPNHLDRCLTEREDRDGFLDEDGCPDPDDDGDGLSDAIDKCPRDPEDPDGYEDLDGCPEPEGPNTP